MVFQPPTIGTLSKFGIGSTSTITTQLEYLTFGLGKHNTVLETAGIRGTHAHPVERTRAGTYTISGPISMHLGPADIDAWFPFVFGNAKSVNTYNLAEAQTPFFVGFDDGIKYWVYNSCKVDRMTLRAQQGGLLEADFDVEGLTETLNTGGTFPALSPTTAAPYVLMDAALTIGGTAYQFRQFETVVDWRLKKDRFMNSVSRTDLPEMDRIITVNLSLPFTSDTIGLYDANQANAAVVATFTNGAHALTLTYAAVQFPTEPPERPGREEILLPYNGIARKTGSTLELVATNT